jgi:DNA-binding response OmpR family regulator
MSRAAAVERSPRHTMRGRHNCAVSVLGDTHRAASQPGDVASDGPILVVDSDPNLGRAIADQLIADGYQVQLARTAEHARVLSRATAPALAVLGNIDCPRGALQLLEEIRESDRLNNPWDEALPTIVLSSRAHELDVLRAFEAGADDFIARPPRYLELRARLRAILRRTGGAPRSERVLEIGPLAIDSAAHAVTLHGEPVVLRRREFELLLHLAGDPRKVFDKDELLRAVWGYRCSGSTRTVDSHASRLRRKLDVDGTRPWVINVWGVGYRLF